MVKPRRPAPSIDPAAAAAFVEGADATATGDTPAARSPRADEPGPLAPPGPRTTRGADQAGEKLPSTMLLRFKEPLDEARTIAALAKHYDRSKQYIAYAALLRGLESMRDDAGLQ